ncbi:CueP family metal-binding protein [Ornithinibacillus halophilus]|uniref:Lipocalin-like domain-containing protein n=1 Tax=Ornithinibacillus halophilus TaxID=930117 RepID=A0A1M5DWM7_9BACI|nr:CueP family metal-binding protein [Ornithinibacillus halophilus]SHF71345.1 hypothetical protein SAMN05216225_100332 [Ornithinibacillus halophilus]
MKKILITLIGILLVLVIAACDESTSNNEETQDVDVKQMVEDYSLRNYDGDVTASITSHELIVTDSDDNETTYDLPEDEFFVSIAPFFNETHPCAIHSLTGCQGELVEEEFDIYIEDEDGNVIVDETIKTMENGFIDLWLPREQTFNVTITQDGKTSESEITTYEGDNTCITTMQLM